MIRSPWLTLIYQLSDYVQNSTRITAPKKQEKKIEFKFKPNQKKDTKKKKKRNIMFKKWTFIVTKTDVTIL